MYNKVFAILIIIFSITIIASNDTFAESKNDMMNMKEDKKNTMDMTNIISFFPCEEFNFFLSS